MASDTELLIIYKNLLSRFGHQGWWPGDSPFEVIIGAILTQSVSWVNVEKAIRNLKGEGILEPEKLYNKEISEIAPLIRSTRFYNEKAQKIKNFMNFLFDEYDGCLQKMSDEDTEILRQKLLGIKGLGEETADSILLYACNKPVFVVDAYTKRIFSRYGLIKEGAGYKEIQTFFLNNLPQDAGLYNDFHAQIVNLGKNICKSSPDCTICQINLINTRTRCRFCIKNVEK